MSDRSIPTNPAEKLFRDARQREILAWAHRAFGGIEGHDPCTPAERARRFAEEAGELVQAVGLTRADWDRIGGYVFGRDVGEPLQEVGGVMLTLAALAEVLGVSVCDAEVAEFKRVLAKSREHFEARHRSKMEVGI